MDKKKPDEQMQYMPIGMSIGIGVGVAIGAAMGNIPVCMCLGLGIGLCLGTAIDAANRKKNEDTEEQISEDN